MTRKSLSVIVMSAVMFLILVSLGAWQWQRMAWKSEILSLIETNRTAPPISLESALQKSKTTIGHLNKAEYSHVQVLGRYHHDKTRYFFTQQKGQVGWTLFTPLEYEKDKFIYINRGFIPDKMRLKQGLHVYAEPNEKVSITGLFRMGLKVKTSSFVLDNAIEKNQYFWRSIEDMVAGSFGVLGHVASLPEKHKAQDSEAENAKQDKIILPFSLDLEKNDHKKQWPQSGTTILKPANNHFTYMMTWFSFAFTLLVITGIFLAGERRKA